MCAEAEDAAAVAQGEVFDCLDRIKELEAERDRYKKALLEILDTNDGTYYTVSDMRDIARAALLQGYKR